MLPRDNNCRKFFKKLLCTSVFLFSHFAIANEVEVVRDMRVSGLEVKIKRKFQPECKNKYNYWIDVNGVIGSDTVEIIARIIDSIDPCFLMSAKAKVQTQVYLNSYGGSMIDGFRLGYLFRQKNVQTEIANEAVCASACATAFLGGVTRVMNGSAVLLFHSPYRNRGIGIDCSNKKAVEIFRNYMVDIMGVRDGGYVFERAMSYCSVDNGWIVNRDAARVFNMTNYEK
jgi:hypothetical protein